VKDETKNPENIEETGDMRTDWDLRAKKNAEKYIACGWHDDPKKFNWSGLETTQYLLGDIWEAVEHGKVLEIGCGTGRILKFLSYLFDEAHGVDVSEEMIRKGREEMRGLDNVKLHVIDGQTFAGLDDECFDVILEFAVFQHIPKKKYVKSLLREAYRVLKPSGLMKFQVQAVIRSTDELGTWHGARWPLSEYVREVREIGFHIVKTHFDLLNFWLVVSKKPGIKLHRTKRKIPILKYWKWKFDAFRFRT